ncbi:large-conductance mechanosensitive channel protein MscL [Akkermansia sp. N21116]|jgi:large conductance mechanosensitive channel|uniref:large-conductance mechanosensitive channel protein MscL n=1 Tax=Akkermansia sp. N21116 TaxID=3040764 RepID=UPI00244E741C|nr:large-conductance mechanosensitive channel protein MscL [Akkermansia sp. N21116]WPX40932.1 large-conductance mechanosensitive channel protein MscL [Akkermansia sp. N21116]
MVNKDIPRKFMQEFKAFAMKGNVVDLAVAVVIGGAFGKIVNSLVADIIMPLVGLLTGGLDLTKDVWVLRAAEDGKPALTLGYGLFLQSVIDFVIVALAIFIMLKILIKARLQQEAKPAPAPVKPDDVVLLEEIRDILKQQK